MARTDPLACRIRAARAFADKDLAEGRYLVSGPVKSDHGGAAAVDAVASCLQGKGP
jgi:hypothetical protein